jgi:5-methylcytosine-specific restriction endonuclease McrA
MRRPTTKEFPKCNCGKLLTRRTAVRCRPCLYEYMRSIDYGPSRHERLCRVCGSPNKVPSTIKRGRVKYSCKDCHARNYKKWQRSHPKKVLEHANRHRMRKAGALGSHTELEWEAICRKQKWRCGLCLQKKPLTVDHIVPVSRGGSDYAFNIQALCKSCNCRKHARVAPGLQHTLFDRIAV